MAHEIMIKNGVAQYASTQKEWHFADTGHQVLRPGAPIEEWVEAAGMNYKVKRATIRYATERLDLAHAPVNALRSLEDKVVLFRSDTGAPLGVVSEGYKVLQPDEVMEALREQSPSRALACCSGASGTSPQRRFPTPFPLPLLAGTPSCRTSSCPPLLTGHSPPRGASLRCVRCATTRSLRHARVRLRSALRIGPSSTRLNSSR